MSELVAAEVPAASTVADKQPFTSWKLDLLTAINLDPAVRDVDMRFVVYLIQGLNQTTRAFNCSDETITDELNCKRDKLTTSRKRLEGAGWLIVRRGRGFADGSWYSFDDQKVERILSDRDDRRAIRKDERADRRNERTRQALRCAEKSLHSAAKTSARPMQRCADISRHSATVSALPDAEPCAEKSLHKGDRCAEKSLHCCAEKSLHIHLRDTPIESPPPPSEGMALGSVVLSDDTVPDRSSWDAEDWQALFDERAGFLEFDCGYSRADAERMAAAEISEMRSAN